MKTLNHFLIFSVIFSGTLLTGLSTAHAAKMSSSTQDQVIQRLERVISALDKTEASWLPSQQRLADLLSERARLRFMEEVEASCEGCKGSKDDRLKAVAIYQNLLGQLKINDHGPILFQLAHLHEMAGQTDQAISLFRQVIREAKAKKISADIVARSHSGLGDLLFQKGQFKEAKGHYELALKDAKLAGRGLVIYNLAWCEFNLDKLNAGVSTMEGLLKKPELITRETEEGIKYDPVFHADIQRDLATFYARRPITTAEIAKYEAFTPKEKRKELLLHFASEADRLGQKKAAATIYNRYLEDESLTREERLEAFVRLAQVNYDGGDTSKSTQDFAKAALEFQNNCKDAVKCEELAKTMKRYVTELHRSKKLKPDTDLLNAYLIYTKTFPDDTEMAQRGSQVADNMGKHAIAMQFARSVSSNKNSAPEVQKAALLSELSTAEKSENPILRKAAYQNYLSVAPQGSKSFEVRYQMAYLSYQEKNHRDAAQAFYTLAMDKSGPAELRKKSADLSLDSLVQMKYEDSLEDWAWQYAAAFPQARREFETIARKALINRVALVANDKNASKSSLAKARDQMQKANFASAKTSEKILLYTNLSVVAQRLQDDETFLRALQSLLSQPGLSNERREETLGKIVSHYEKKLDFKAAYNMALKMNFPRMAKKEKELRLGTLADLASLNPTQHYRKALVSGLKGESARSVKSRLVLLSSHPVRELKTHVADLAKDPGLLNEITLLVFARTGDKKGLKPVLVRRELRNQSAPNFIEKQDFYNEISNFKAKIARHRLNAKTDSRLQKTLKERMKLLKEADAELSKSLKFKDITAQLLALNIVATENSRMAQDLATLPVPAKLTAAEKNQYLELMKQQTKPYFVKAKFAQERESEIWERSPNLPQLLKEYTVVRPELKKLLRRELQLLTTLPGNSRMHSQVRNAINEETLTWNDLVAARKTVAANPNNINDLEKLKSLETKIGHPLMPSYLEARLNQIQRGTSL